MLILPMNTQPYTDELAVHALVRAEIERKLAAVETPVAVREFLLGQWSRLMTGLYMARGEQDPDWHAGWETVSGLIYSLQPKRSVQETEQFLRELPQLLWRLHEGCAALSLPTQERDDLFAQLALLHAAVARDGLQLKRKATSTHLGHVEDPDDTPTGLQFARDTGHTPPARQSVSSSDMPDLSQGDRVSFRIDGMEKVLVLTGKSPMGGMYMFTNEAGVDAHTFTHTRLKTKFRDGSARRLA